MHTYKRFDKISKFDNGQVKLGRFFLGHPLELFSENDFLKWRQIAKTKDNH
jgi:hypothetical protein